MHTTQLTETQSHTSPIHALPTELLVAIFVRCLPYHDIDAPLTFSIDNAHEAALRRMPPILASVCQEWRLTAHNTSELWSTCTLNFVRPELNAVWLERAKGRALHLDGRAVPGSLLLGQAINATDFLRSISPFLPRCHSLIIPTEILGESQYSITESQVAEYITDASQLRVLRTCPSTRHQLFALRDRMTLPPWIHTLIKKAPNINVISLWEYFAPYSDSFGDPTPIEIDPLSQLVNLTDVQLNGVLSLFDLNGVLRHSPNLERLNITVISGPVDDSPAGRVELPLVSLVHTRLVRLELTPNPCYSEESAFLESVTLPALQALILRFEMETQTCDAVKRMLDRSQCSLKELEVCTGTWRHWVSVLPHILLLLQHESVHASLELFAFSGGFITNEFLDFFTVDTTRGVASLPRLRRLAFLDINPTRINRGKIPKLVISRSCSRLGKDVDGSRNDGTFEPVAELEHFEFTVQRSLVGAEGLIWYGVRDHVNKLRIQVEFEGEMDWSGFVNSRKVIKSLRGEEPEGSKKMEMDSDSDND